MPIPQSSKVLSPGHGLGGRLLSAAALGTGEFPLLIVQKLSLLQATFSHYGFAKKFNGIKDGFSSARWSKIKASPTPP